MSITTIVRIEVNGSLEDSHLFGQIVTGLRDIPETRPNKVPLPYDLNTPTQVIVQTNNNEPAAFRILKNPDVPSNEVLEIKLAGQVPKKVIQQILYRSKETLYNMHWHGRKIASYEVNVRTELD